MGHPATAGELIKVIAWIHRTIHGVLDEGCRFIASYTRAELSFILGTYLLRQLKKFKSGKN